ALSLVPVQEIQRRSQRRDDQHKSDDDDDFHEREPAAIRAASLDQLSTHANSLWFRQRSAALRRTARVPSRAVAKRGNGGNGRSYGEPGQLAAASGRRKGCVA